MLGVGLTTALVAASACGLDAIGSKPLEEEDASATPNAAETGTTTPDEDSGGELPPPESDADATVDDDASEEKEDASTPVDAGTDARSSDYRADWFDLRNATANWIADWWKADTCRDKAGWTGSKIGPKIIDSSNPNSLQRKQSPPPQDKGSSEKLLKFPSGSIWPDKNGVAGIFETDGPVVPTHAFCGRLWSYVYYPAGNYVLHYEVSDSLAVFVDGKFITGPKWYEDISTIGLSGTTQKDQANLTIGNDGLHTIEIYYDNVVGDALLTVTLSGPL